MATTPNPIDRAQRLLEVLGGSYGDMRVNGVWQVYAHRDEQRIVTRPHLQAEAWDEALRQAGIIQRGP
jgi:hypothetical protein